MSSEPQVKYARTSDGVNIAWYAVGDGLPYVWPAAAPSNILYQWGISELREALELYVSRGATLILYDSRGFGLSDRGLMDHSCEAMVRDLEAVVEAAGVDRFVLQSFSYMSVPVLAYAARHPERVIALVLLNGVMRGSDLNESWETLVRIAADDWEEATLMLARRNEAGWASTISSLDQVRQSLDRASTQEEFLAFCEAMAGWDVSDQVASVTQPALVLHYSGLPSFIPLEASRRLAASLPNGTFGSVEMSDRAAVFNVGPKMRDFLRHALPEDARRRAPVPLPSGTAVILFADIADSTALTERLGDDAFRAKARELDGALRATIRENGGTAIEGKLLGDGVLAVFTSARRAIEAALACGRSGDEGGLPLHLGLHAGDVTREEDPDGRGNVYGGAVNIAARVSALAAPGEVLVSQTVRDLARTSAGVAFEERGERELKGVSEPVRVWAVGKREGA